MRCESEGSLPPVAWENTSHPTWDGAGMRYTVFSHRLTHFKESLSPSDPEGGRPLRLILSHLGSSRIRLSL